MVDRVFLELWERKMRGRKLEERYFKEFPIRKFDIGNIQQGIKDQHELSELSMGRASVILSDLKILFYFLGNVVDYFYVGVAEIVGNSEYDEVNLNTLSIMQGNHYSVYLISVVYERILDLLELVYFNSASDPKKNKWGKKYERLRNVEEFDLISKYQHEKMIEFRNRVRRAEIHGLSSVFGQLRADKWDHFQDEENIVRDILIKVSEKYV